MSYQCDSCKKYIKPDPAAFKVGDLVKFTRSQQRGRTVVLTSTDGTVVEADEWSLRVKTKRNGTFEMDRGDATPQDAPGPLTYALCGVCECGDRK